MSGKLVPLISESAIAATVKRLAQELDRDYAERSPILIGILKGSFVFLADLMRQMQTPIHRIELIKMSSYGASTVSSGEVKLLMGLPDHLITDQHVILVEDIVDTGSSTAMALKILQSHHPASIKLCALLDKPERRKVPVEIDYLGITVPDRFIVGYGLDAYEQYRQFPAIYALNE
ncbi:MAG: hypoxanthine phosphoribosyltransferase [Leptolyngbyaceae bacterium]|nr:hypoxanthine phosphoribosyltransferase [Leptolyngbyaceae bacterium]